MQLVLRDFLEKQPLFPHVLQQWEQTEFLVNQQLWSTTEVGGSANGTSEYAAAMQAWRSGLCHLCPSRAPFPELVGQDNLGFFTAQTEQRRGQVLHVVLCVDDV